MIKEFKKFVMQGNVLDMATGIVIGVAFGGVIQSFVKDVLMPPIGLLLGKVDFSNLFINMSGKSYESLAEAQKAGAATLNYGVFANAVVNFLIIAFAIFLILRVANKGRPATTKSCQFCTSTIPIAAVKCPHCTSDLEVGA
jgi:large conductance mechanosensitive channel